MTESPQHPDPSLINDDIRPVLSAERHWSVMDMASLWIGMVVCVPTYMLAAGLISQGMSWSEAVGTVLLGNLIVLVPMILNGHPGTKYGVPFPVLARAAFGIRGAHVPSLLRALVACGWFGIQTWMGGSAIFQLVNVATSGGLDATPLGFIGISFSQLVCFFIFWGVQVAILWRGVESIRALEVWAAPFLIAMGLALLGWAYSEAGGFGPMLATPSQFAVGGPKEGQLASVFFPSLTAMVGFWATLSLNIPDFTRYAKTQRDQVLGQAIGLPATMTLFAFIGVATTAATVLVFGQAIAYPDQLVTRFGSPLIVGVSMLGLAIATLSTNIAANVVSPANDFANLAPAKISYRAGGIITAVIGVLICPWLILKSAGNYIFVWLVGYGVLLGPIGAIMIIDYFVLRRRELAVDDLYRRGGQYEYANGINPSALIAFALGVAPCLPGFLVAASGAAPSTVPAFFNHLYTWAWFVSSGVSAAAYYALMRRRV